MKIQTIDDLKRARPEHIAALQKTYSFIQDFLAWMEEHRNRRTGENEIKVVTCRECGGTGEVTLRPRRTHVAHPSSFSPDACLHRIWLDVMGDMEEISNFDAKTLVIFDHGHSVHGFLQEVARKMYGDAFAEEVPAYMDEWLISGSADGLLELSTMRLGLEFKTINDRGFKNLSGPLSYHLWQAMAYLKALDLPFMLFVYFNKDTSQMVEYWVTFNETTWGLVQGMLQEVFDADDEEGPGPYKPGGAGMVNKFKCKDCVYNHACPHNQYKKGRK